LSRGQDRDSALDSDIRYLFSSPCCELGSSPLSYLPIFRPVRGTVSLPVKVCKNYASCEQIKWCIFLDLAFSGDFDPLFPIAWRRFFIRDDKMKRSAFLPLRKIGRQSYLDGPPKHLTTFHVGLNGKPRSSFSPAFFHHGTSLFSSLPRVLGLRAYPSVMRSREEK